MLLIAPDQAAASPSQPSGAGRKFVCRWLGCDAKADSWVADKDIEATLIADFDTSPRHKVIASDCV